MGQILQVIGKKKSGKTTTILSFIEVTKQYNVALAVLKHSHHDTTIDPPQTDTERFFKAGAQQVGLKSNNEFFWRAQTTDFELEAQLQSLLQTKNQLILLEGFKQASYPKLLLLRPQDKRSDFSGRFDAVASLQLSGNPQAPLDFSAEQTRKNWFQQWLKKNTLLT